MRCLKRCSVRIEKFRNDRHHTQKMTFNLPNSSMSRNLTLLFLELRFTRKTWIIKQITSFSILSPYWEFIGISHVIQQPLAQCHWCEYGPQTHMKLKILKHIFFSIHWIMIPRMICKELNDKILWSFSSHWFVWISFEMRNFSKNSN